MKLLKMYSVYILIFILILGCDEKSGPLESEPINQSNDINKWIGNYTGQANYWDIHSNEENIIPITVSIVKFSETYPLAISVYGGYESVTVAGELDRPDYIHINMDGSHSEFGNIREKVVLQKEGNELTGYARSSYAQGYICIYSSIVVTK